MIAEHVQKYFDEIPNSLYQYSKLGKDLNKVFRNRSIKSIVEKSYFDHKINNEARNRLEHNSNSISIFRSDPINQNIICSYQLENQSDTKNFNFFTTINKKEFLTNRKKSLLITNENAIFKKDNLNQEMKNKKIAEKKSNYKRIETTKQLAILSEETNDLCQEESMTIKKNNFEGIPFNYKYNPKYDLVLKRIPRVIMTKSKRPENLFTIDHSLRDIPLNHSLSLDNSFILKSMKYKKTYENPKSQQNSKITGKIQKSSKKINDKKTLYITDLLKSDKKEKIISTFNKQKISKSNSRSNSKSSSRQSLINLNEDRFSQNVSEKKKNIINNAPFNSATLRDCGENFILNNNPGVGLYNTDIILKDKKRFNSMFTGNNQKKKVRKIWNDRYIRVGYKYVDFK